MTLLDYWPTSDGVTECVRSDADAASDAVLLAVHRPMRLRRLEPGGVAVATTEAEVSEYLLRPNPPDGRVLIPIEGSSGVGKSHLIRWLSIQARHGSESDRRHVIAIPKGAGLRRALGLMLEGLSGPRYDRIRSALDGAREKLTDDAAEVYVRANLEVALRERVKETKTRLDANPDPVRAARKRRLQKAAIDRETQALLNDADLVEWLGPGLVEWLNTPATNGPMLVADEKAGFGILAALARRVTQGNKVTDDGPELRSEFRESDFLLESTPAGGSAALKTAVRNFAATAENGGPGYRAAAVRVLNELVDGAIARLIQPSDHNVSELFEGVRAELLKDDKELVLLVEDFANLAGIQGTLFQAMIADTTRHGKAALCVVRAAFAVTPGYMDRYDTGQTRAVYRWVIDDVPPGTEQDLLDGVVELAASYLNAARLGQAELERRLRLAGDPASDWLPTFDPADQPSGTDPLVLEAFGRSASGFPLFPFNRAALEQLARHHLREGNRLIFKPRYVITRFLEPILRNHRETFRDGQFPPPAYPGYEGIRLGADVINKRLKGLSGDRRGRYEVLLGFWGGLPQTLDQLRLAVVVYRAFGLDPLSEAPPGVPPPP
ncbi:MAG TPA: protein DpdH, partial [Urbifossiella sp.]|nr:protein DpdH [Urbifossiella sp.]